jgi:hypothetical protein
LLGEPRSIQGHRNPAEHSRSPRSPQ